MITVRNNEIPSFQHKNLAVKLEDRGRARVSISLMIGPHIRVEHDETWEGARESILQVEPGEYSCLASVRAYASPLGGNFDTKISVGGICIAVAEGALDDGAYSDSGSIGFQMTIV